MAERPDDLRDPAVLVIEDDFSVLPEDEKARLSDEWLKSLQKDDPVDLPMSSAELIAEVRDEAGW